LFFEFPNFVNFNFQQSVGKKMALLVFMRLACALEKPNVTRPKKSLQVN